MRTREFNFDGLVGPTHNYGGLSFGNIASTQHASAQSNPREAALQGLAKIRSLYLRGVGQGLLPPQERPDLATLRQLGFSGSDRHVIESAWKNAPELLVPCYSASSMWAANAATVSPSADTADGRVHFTVANLVSNFHRAIEPKATQEILNAVFQDPDHFAIHPALPSTESFSDEGAANHGRLCATHEDPGLELFVYGHHGTVRSGSDALGYPARQSLNASRAVVRLHQLASSRVIYARQSVDAINAGVFHNDVISVANENVFLYHQDAFSSHTELNEKIGRFFGDLPHYLLEVPAEEVSLEEAVESYLFNSQLVSLAEDRMLLVLPGEAEEHPGVRACLDRLVSEQNPITETVSLDLRQSMQNGGGPACLRLRVVLTPDEVSAVRPGCLVNEERIRALETWVRQHYRDRLVPDDLADPDLAREAKEALDQLTDLLDLGPIYRFQRESGTGIH